MGITFIRCRSAILDNGYSNMKLDYYMNHPSRSVIDYMTYLDRTRDRVSINYKGENSIILRHDFYQLQSRVNFKLY